MAQTRTQKGFGDEKKTIVFGLIISILIIYSCVLVIRSQKHSIKGNYCTLPEEQFLPENLYIAVLNDNTFVISKNNEAGIHGKLELKEFDRLAYLNLITDDNMHFIAVYDFHNSIIFVGSFIKGYECPLEFKRISSTPVMVNVEDSADEPLEE